MSVPTTDSCATHTVDRVLVTNRLEEPVAFLVYGHISDEDFESALNAELAVYNDGVSHAIERTGETIRDYAWFRLNERKDWNPITFRPEPSIRYNQPVTRCTVREIAE